MLESMSIELRDFKKNTDDLDWNDKSQSLVKKTHEVLCLYFKKNFPNDKEEKIIKKYIPDFEAPENNLLASASRLFSSHGKQGRDRAINFLAKLDSHTEYLELLKATHDFCASSGSIPQGSLRKSLLNLLINELGIINNFTDEAEQKRVQKYQSQPPVLLRVGNTYTTIANLTAIEDDICSVKLKAVEERIRQLEATNTQVVMIHTV